MRPSATGVALLALIGVLMAGVLSSAGITLAAGDADAEENASIDVAPETVGRLATIRVSARSCNGRMLGSGFLVDSGLVTVDHVVADVGEAKLDQPVEPAIAAVTTRSAARDLALLDPVDGLILELAGEAPVIGDPVVLAGHADGGRTQVVEGTVQQVVAFGDPYGVAGEILLVEGEVGGGFSGGPVLDHRGDVVGVIKGFEPTLELTIVVSASTVSEWLNEPRAAPVQVSECPS